MNLLVYLPVAAKKPVPVFLGLSFAGIWTVATDPGVPLGDQWVRNPQTREYEKQPANEKARGARGSQWQAEKILDAGYGLAVFDYGNVEPDFAGALKHSIRTLFLKPGEAEPGPNAWGAIGAWAWAASRAMDYLEEDKDVDAKRVGLFGHSRLGRCAGYTLLAGHLKRKWRGRRGHQPPRVRRTYAQPEHQFSALVRRQLQKIQRS
jgi:hypothetical protein